MPVRPRVQRVSERAVDPELFAATDGTWCYFGLKAVYPDQATAERAWRRDRRPAWLRTHRFALPKAAEAYDGLTRRGWELLWSAVNSPWRYELPAILTAIDDDERAVETFIARDDRGARQIADCLIQFREDLATLRQLAHELTDDAGSAATAPHEQCSSLRGQPGLDPVLVL